MTLTDIANIRTLNQKIDTTEFKTAKEIVAWMGAMQAQDYSMAKWAVGVRLLNLTDEKIEAAFNRGEIIRTHIMRPTWHFVSAEDIYWMLELTAPKIKSSLKSRHKELELSDAILAKSYSIIEKALSKSINLSREELAKKFEDAKIRTNDNRLSHFLLCAELNGIVCSGPIKDKKQTFTLLNERVPHKKFLTRNESLAELARRYFTSHCPASLADFTWWSGLSAVEARQALEFIKPDFIAEKIDSEEYWFTNSFSSVTYNKDSIYLLPAFDEFLISYKNRSASLSMVDNKKAVSDNGIFRPVIILNGQVVGIWKRTTKKDKIIIETNFFQPQQRQIKELVKISSKELEHFYNKPIVFI